MCVVTPEFFRSIASPLKRIHLDAIPIGDWALNEKSES